MARNGWLVAAGILSTGAALLHLAAIVGGADWYRFFGAGEAIARAAERGSIMPAVLTFAMASILGIWALYAFSAAGLFRRLPLIRTALLLISAIYLLRGLALVPLLILRPNMVGTFAMVSSLVVLVYGVVQAIGTWRGWQSLSTAAALLPCVRERTRRVAGPCCPP
ncbi:hypothetical protein [Sphingosinicella sp. BN140058]|uniref:hypothetical protein n=1 Tax=Sphingosinicella sp. BN140058 TaxID=1892855 RepID=UPI001980C2BD|nr:hypothetical protein [Sphingosinicella sp. BN140058]